MNNYERIKNMTLDEMAIWLKDFLCEQCEISDLCEQRECWLFDKKGYKCCEEWLKNEFING